MLWENCLLIKPGEDEADLNLKKMLKSPLAQELLNKKIGDIVVVEAPAE